MKLGLVGKLQARSRLEAAYRSSTHLLNINQPCPMGRCQFTIQELLFMLRPQEQITIKPRKITVNVLFLNDKLDALNGGGMALGGQACAFFTVKALDLEI